MPSYTAPTRDARFIINEMLDLAGYADLPGFEAASVDVTYEAWDDMIHGWHGNSDVLPEALDAIAAIGAFFKRKIAA